MLNLKRCPHFIRKEYDEEYQKDIYFFDRYTVEASEEGVCWINHPLTQSVWELPLWFQNVYREIYLHTFEKRKMRMLLSQSKNTAFEEETLKILPFLGRKEGKEEYEKTLK